MQEEQSLVETHSLETFLVTKFSRAMHTWPTDFLPNIYALSLYCDEHDTRTPYRPNLYLQYNTRTHLALPRNVTSGEAKWNLTLWVRPPVHLAGPDINTTLGPGDKWIMDTEGQRLLDVWIYAVLGERSAEDAYEVIQPLFIALACRVGRLLHDSGHMRAIFGRDVPIIMHDDEWGEAITLNTAAANPPGVADEFLHREEF